jgi:AcrR family transcriptional regulator
VLVATRDLLTSGSYEQLTIEGIAAAARVGRQTVYRWWPSKSAVVAEVVLSGHLRFDTEAPPDTGDLRADLTRWLSGVLDQLGDPGVVTLIRGLTAAALESPDIMVRLFAEITAPFRERMRRRIDQGLADGQVRADVDLDAATDSLLGVVFLQAMAGAFLAGRGEAASFVDVFLDGVGAVHPR